MNKECCDLPGSIAVAGMRRNAGVGCLLQLASSCHQGCYLGDGRSWMETTSTEEPAIAETLTIIKGFKDKAIKSVGVAGFCYGELATVVAKEGTADAVVLLYPSRVTLDDIKQVKGAIAILSADPTSIRLFQTSISGKRYWNQRTRWSTLQKYILELTTAGLYGTMKMMKSL